MCVFHVSVLMVIPIGNSLTAHHYPQHRPSPFPAVHHSRHQRRSKNHALWASRWRRQEEIRRQNLPGSGTRWTFIMNYFNRGGRLSSDWCYWWTIPFDCVKFKRIFWIQCNVFNLYDFRANLLGFNRFCILSIVKNDFIEYSFHFICSKFTESKWTNQIRQNLIYRIYPKKNLWINRIFIILNRIT